MLRKAILCVVASMTPLSLAEGGEAYRLLSAKGEADQRAILAGAFAGTGLTCAAPSRLFYKGEGSGSDFWALRCREGDFLVRIENTGGMRATVLECPVAKAMGLECWAPF